MRLPVIVVADQAYKYTLQMNVTLYEYKLKLSNNYESFH